MIKTFGPYDSKKSAMRANCLINMKGEFGQGRGMLVDGRLMVSTGCTAKRDFQADGWIATVQLREATETELKQYADALAKRDAQLAEAGRRTSAEFE